MNIGTGSWHQPVPMPTFRTGLFNKPGPTLWLYNPPPSSPSFPSRHLQEQFKTTPTTTPTSSGCRISPPPSPTTSRSVPPPTPPHRSPPARFLYRRRRCLARPAAPFAKSSTATPPPPPCPAPDLRRRRLSPTGESRSCRRTSIYSSIDNLLIEIDINYIISID